MTDAQVTAAQNGYGWLTPPQAAATNALFGFGSGGGGGSGGGAGGSGGSPGGGNQTLPNIYIQDLPPAIANPGDLWIQGATAWGANENGDWQRPGGETETSTSVIGYYGPFASANAGTGGAAVGNSDLNAAIYAGVAGLGLWASRNVALSQVVTTAGRTLAPVGAVLDLTPQGRVAAIASGAALLGAGALYGLNQRPQYQGSIVQNASGDDTSGSAPPPIGIGHNSGDTTPLPGSEPPPPPEPPRGPSPEAAALVLIGAAALSGRPTPINPSDDAATTRGLTLENDSAVILANNGYQVEQNPTVPGGKTPDFRINGDIFDAYSPETGSVRNIWSTVLGKVESGQAPNIVLNLGSNPAFPSSSATVPQIINQFNSYPISGLGKMLIIDQTGVVYGWGG